MTVIADKPFTQLFNLNLLDELRIRGVLVGTGTNQVTVDGGTYMITGAESFIFAKGSPTITFPAANDVSGPFPYIPIRTRDGVTTLAVAGGTIETTTIPNGASVVLAPDAIDNGWFEIF